MRRKNIMSDEKNNHPEEEPQLFSVKKSHDGGWQFSRRDFIKGAGAVGIVSTLGGCGAGDDAVTSTPRPSDIGAHDGSVKGFAITPDGSTLISVSEDDIKLWSMETKGLIRKLPITVINGINAFALSPDGQTIILGLDNGVKRVHISDSTQDLILNRSIDNPITAVAITPDGNQLIAGDDSGFITIWSVQTDEQSAYFEANWSSKINALAITSDGHFLIHGADTVKIWSLVDGALVGELETQNLVNALAISPDGKILVTAGAYASLQIWSLADNHLISSLTGHVDWLNVVTISPDGALLASGGRDNAIRLWSLPTGEPLATLHTDSSGVCLCISPDGKILFSGEANGKIRFWSLPDGNLIGELIDIEASSTNFQGVQYSPNDEGSSVITQPCGSPIPAGSTCICNCVAGNQCGCVGNKENTNGSGGGGTHYWYPN
jgi:WD40 repeat protein